MENFKVADMGLAERDTVILTEPFAFTLPHRFDDNWAVTERALMDAENHIGVRGPFSSFAEMMADIDADS